MNTVIREVPTAQKDEEALIGCLLVEPRQVLPLISPIVTGSDFFDDDLGKLFTAIVLLADSGQPVDNLPWLGKELQKHGVPKAAIDQVARLYNQVPHWGHCTWHAEHVRDAARLRNLCRLSSELAKRAYDHGADAGDVEQWLQSQLARLDSGASESKLIEEIAAESVARIEESASAPNKPGIYLGLSLIDQFTGPFLPGELVTIAARPGIGKSALGAQIAMHNAERDRGGLFVSLEMKDKEIVDRILCGRAGVDSRLLRAGTVEPAKRQLIREEASAVKGLPLWMHSPPTATLNEIRAHSRYRASRNGIRFVVVDYLNMVKPSADERKLDRHLQVQAVTTGLKRLAKELDVVVFALCQVSRAGDGEPQLVHLRESGSIEQDSDAVLLLNVQPEREGNGPRSEFREASLNIAKFRAGAVGTIRLKFIPKSTSFVCEDEFR